MRIFSILHRLARRLILSALLALSCTLPASAASSSSVFCDQDVVLTASEKNQLLNFSGAVRDVLQNSGDSVAIISRSGIDLDRFKIRYSHSGIVLKNTENASWAVRQLYYGCEEGKPSIYDQGLSGFLMDHDTRSIPFVSLVFIPAPLNGSLDHTARDQQTALNLLGPGYSANAYPFSTEFQNCNQWLMEMLAYAWGHLQVSDDYRQAAQQWLKDNDYQPSTIDVQHRYIVWASHVIPLVHNSDQPAENLDKNLYQVSMPMAIEGFVKTRAPTATRVELCLKHGEIVIHHGWDMIADDCVAAAGDEVVSAY